MKNVPSSVPARISVIKMNILPRINFVSSMIPLAPPPMEMNDNEKAGAILGPVHYSNAGFHIRNMS